jgi:1,2-diacylglycerol 3-beta-galactosyltransferase
MRDKKILFLEASSGGGHISITTAIIQALQKKAPGIQPIRVDVIPPFVHKFYQLTSRQFVNAFMLFYKATDNQHAEFFASKFSANTKKLTKTIIENQPDIIISNSYLGLNEVPKIIEKMDKSIPFLVFVPDPFTFHNLYLSKKATLTLVSTLTSYQAALNNGIKPEKLKITGHPIREEFRQIPPDIKTHRKNLGLDPDKFTILFGGSGHGAEKTLEILMHLGAKPGDELTNRLIRSANLDYKTYYKLFLKVFNRQKKNIPEIQAICVCGDNTELKEELEMLNFPSYIQPIIHQQSNNMADLMHAADLIVGKAGPNALFESIMSGKPFIATYHIKGQENGNIDFIRSMQVGFVEENPQKAAYLIEIIVKNKKLLEYTQKGISFAKQEHEDAADKIAKQILSYIKK